MDKENSTGLFANLKHDLPSSVVVFLVALPLCLGIALASGAPLFSGIIAGIVGGIVVASLSGSPLGVSGPAAGLAAIVLKAISDLGSFEIFLMAVVVAGALQFIFGLLKAGIIAHYFPSSVIKGMLSGIGLLIIWKEIPYALGSTAKETLGDMIETMHMGPVVITLVSMVILILWEQSFIKKNPILGKIQGPLLVVVVGIFMGTFFAGGDMELTKKMLVKIPEKSPSDFIELFTMPDFSQWNNFDVYIIAFTMALVASLETLLCVEATDKLDPQKRITPTNRELVAQGVGNMVSGMIGGLPITQVIVRSSANIQSGGRTKLSAIVHGILLLVCALTIPFILNMIPLASLAAILFIVGYKLAKPALFKDLFQKGWEQFLPFIITIAGILFKDLLVGIGLGLLLAVLQILRNNYRMPYHLDEEDLKSGKPITITLAEDVSFLNKASILNTFNEIPEGAELIIDAKKVKSIHPDVTEIIEDFKVNAETKNIKVTYVA